MNERLKKISVAALSAVYREPIIEKRGLIVGGAVLVVVGGGLAAESINDLMNMSRDISYLGLDSLKFGLGVTTALFLGPAAALEGLRKKL